jgi:hypothetical protein
MGDLAMRVFARLWTLKDMRGGAGSGRLLAPSWQDGRFPAAHFIGHYRSSWISKIGHDSPILGGEIYMSFAASLGRIFGGDPGREIWRRGAASALTCGSRHVPQQ